jgi:hypothetical protein
MSLAAAEAGTLDLLALLVVGSSLLIFLIRIVIVIIGRKAQIFSQRGRHIDYRFFGLKWKPLLARRPLRGGEPKS